MSFQCIVVTPEQQVLDETVSQVILPSYDGLVGLQTNRAPMLAKLGVGPLRVDLANGQKQFYFVDGGIAQMKDNKLTILTQEATPAKQIDAEAARAEYAEAAARKIPDEKAFADRQHRMARARARQELAKV